MRKTCDTCKYCETEAYQEPCCSCRYTSTDAPTKWASKYNPSTNADLIRTMGDEELAKFLECFGLCHYCTEHHRLGDLRIYADEKCDEKCVEHCLEWLKQPAEVDNG